MRYDPTVNRSFISEKDFLKGLTPQRMDCYRLKESGIPLFVKNRIAYTDTSDSHTLIVGPTGTKKTRNCLLPTIYMLGSAGESMIITDCKGVLFQQCSAMLRMQNYNIKVINFRDMERSHSWNPLGQAYKFYKAGNMQMASTLVSNLATQLQTNIPSEHDRYWEIQAAEMFEGLCHALLSSADPEEINIKSIIMMRSLIAEKGSSIRTDRFWDFVESFPEDSITKLHLASLYNLRDVQKTLNSIISTFDALIKPFKSNNALMEMLSVNDIDYDEIISKRSAVFIITNDEDSSLDALIAVFVKEFYEYVIKSSNNYPNGELPIRMNFLLDEFCNTAKMSAAGNMLSASRSRNIRFFIVIQSYNQLVQKYGKEAEAIKSNCNNILVLPTKEISLLNEIKELCGDYRDKQGNKVPVMDAKMLQMLRSNCIESEALVLRKSQKPFLTIVKDMSEYEQSKYPSLSLPNIKKPNAPYFKIYDYMDELATKSRKSNKLTEITSIDDLFV